MPLRVLPGSLEKVRTHCNLCAMQCGFKLLVEPRNNHVLGVEGDEDFPTTHGLMCIKGNYSTQQIDHPDRLLYPQMREDNDDPLRTVSWDEALAFCAGKIQEIQNRDGRQAAGVYGGGSLINETIYLLSKFSRSVLRTPHIDYNGRFCMSSAAAAQNKAYGVDRGLPFPVSDIVQAKFILLAGANIAECLPPLIEVFKEARARGAVVFVLDPRRTETLRIADRHLAVKPGTDLAFAQAVLHVIFREGWENQAFIEAHTRNADAVRESVRRATPEWAAGVTGVEAQDIELTARLLSQSSTAMVLTARGGEQQSKGVDTVLSFINLLLAVGKIGAPGSGYGTLTGQGNGQGGREHGQKADQLPGYRKITDPAHRQQMATFWKMDEKDLPGPGLSAYELLDAAAQGKIRALFVMGSNPAMSAPALGPIRQGLKDLEFLAVTDSFPSETAALAHVVFPAVVWAEESGTTTNLEGRVILREKAVTSPGEAWPDWKILCELARRLGASSGFSFADVEEVFQEFRRATAGGIADYSGITYDRIRKEKGIPWPCPAEDHPGTPRLFEDLRFWHPDGRAVFHPVVYRPTAEETDNEYPFYLTTGRLLEQYLTGNQTHRIPDLEKFHKEPLAAMHPSAAEKIGVAEGEAVIVTSRRGRVRVAVEITEGIRSDTIFMPIHWGGDRCVNILTNAALDPVSRMPEFKACAVKIEKEPIR